MSPCSHTHQLDRGLRVCGLTDPALVDVGFGVRCFAANAVGGMRPIVL